MQDGQDDLDQDDLDLSNPEPPPEQPGDVHDWLDAAIRATVDLRHGRGAAVLAAAPARAEARWPQDAEQDAEHDAERGAGQDEESDDDRDAEPARFTPASPIGFSNDNDRPARPSYRNMRAPIWLPQPKEITLRERLAPLFRYGPVIVGAAVVAYGITLWGSPVHHVTGEADAKPVVVDAQTEAQLTPHLIVHDQHVLANEPLPLDVSVDHRVANATLRVAGLAAGTHLSSGKQVGDASWAVPLDGVKNLFMYAPTDFVGVMNSAVDLRGPDQRVIDRRKVRLEWVEPKKPVAPVSVPKPAANPAPVAEPTPAPAPAAAAPPAMSAEVVAALLQRGQDYLKNGDIASARIVFVRLAAGGVADGAYAAAQSYDSAYLAAHNVFGVSGDDGKAREYYQQAAQLGSTEAAAKLAGAVAK